MGIRPVPHVLAAGHTLTDEPGYYESGHFGVRHENVMLVVKADTKYNFKGTGYLGFEQLTMAPIQKEMLDPDMLTLEEVFWLNEYHEQVLDRISPLIDDAECKKWLEKACAPM
eukprot:gene5228-5290_t